LINGPVDCDKLDYLARDAFSAGVPIALDSGRLISKLRLATIESDEGQPYISLAIVMSGTRALDELLVSRLFLFDKFYFHPKVMAAEEAVRSGLRAMARAVPSFLNPVTLLDYGDDELLHLRSEDVEARYGVTRTNTDVVRAIELFGRVRNHDLPKRAFAFAVRFMAKVPSLIVKYEYQDNFDEAASVNEVEFKQLGRNLEDPVWLERFTGRLNELAREIGVESDAYIAHQVAERVTKATHLPVVMAGGVVAQHPPFLFKAHEWTEAYALNRATSYVFAYSDLEKVHLAAERLFLLERGMPHFAPSCASIAKLSEDRLQRERENLPLEWTDHRLRQDYLSTQDATRRVAALRDKFATFLNAFDRRIASRLIEAWLYQFPTADLQESAICLLEHLKYYEKSDILDGFKVLIGNHSELKSALWIPFVAQTDPGKSADVLVADVRPLDVFCRKIGELDVSTIEKFEHVVFFDDAINTGTQALTLLRSWFGAEADGTDVLSDRDEPLSEDVRDALRKAKIHFVVFAKHHQGESHLRNGVRDLALGTVEVLSVVDSASLEHTLSGLMCSTEKSKALLIEYMKQQGEQLLARRAHAKGWPPEQQAKFALGFGELHLTIAFHHSISTALPAVLWEHLDGPTKYWLPLFPRDREAVRKALTTPDVQTPPDELPLYPD
jgi:deoxynucleoside triphosphate triphosphohydrolase SAMHD1